MKTALRNRISATMIAMMFATLTACGAGGNSAPATVSDPAVQIAFASQAMGGAAALQAVQSQTITAAGQRFEAEQTVAPGDPPRTVSNFQLTLSQDLTNNRLRFDWQWNIVYPFTAQLQFSDVTDGNIGFVAGQDSTTSPAQAPMPSARLAVMRKMHRLSSPLVLMRAANSNPGVVEGRLDEAFQGKLHRVIAIPAAVSPIRLFIDPDSGLPAKADTIEDDPYYGDTRFEAIFADWRQVGGIMMPFALTLRLQGITFHTETRSAIQNNPPLPADFTIPAALQTAFNAADALRGERRSQWFFRRQALGLPGYADQSLSVVFTQIAPGVFHVTGGSHNTLMVDMGDHLVAVEAPLDEARSLAVIEQAKTLIPGKPIRFVVNSHFHLDHGGGIRAYAAEGATLVVGEASRQRFTDILLAPHTLVPDALELIHRAPAIQTVGAAAPVILNGAARTLAVYPVATGHSADMVIAYLPPEGIVFVSDLFSPAGDFTLAALPADLTAAFTRFGLAVQRIAGGHGTVGALLP